MGHLANKSEVDFIKYNARFKQVYSPSGMHIFRYPPKQNEGHKSRQIIRPGHKIFANLFGYKWNQVIRTPSRENETHIVWNIAI